MKIVDARGKICPMPLIMTKKALNSLKADELLEIHIDNETSVSNVKRFLDDHNIKVSIEKHEKDYKMLVTKTGNIPEQTKAEDYCELPKAGKNGYIIAFQKDMLGQGPEELGKLLIKGFINTLPELEQMPETLVFMNSGIFLALKDSPVNESLKKMEAAGVSILVCGTCLDYFDKKQELGAGVISNMYDILDKLSAASKVLYP